MTYTKTNIFKIFFSFIVAVLTSFLIYTNSIVSAEKIIFQDNNFYDVNIPEEVNVYFVEEYYATWRQFE